MAVNLSPVGGVAAQFFTNNGVPLAGGKLYSYTAGTTTPQATYTSSNGATAHANPIVLNAAGRVSAGGEIWLTDGLQYKFVLKDSNDVTLATYDNILGINSNFVNFVNDQEIQTATAGQTVFTLTTMQYQPGTGSLSVFVDGVNQYGPGAQYAYVETDSTTVTFVTGLHVGASVKFTTSAINASSYGDASQISYTPPFTGSVTTNVEAKLAQTVSIFDFLTGAQIAQVQAGTSTEDLTNVVLTAIAAADEVYFPAGTYHMNVVLDGVRGKTFIGEGRDVTTFKNFGDSAVFTLDSSTADCKFNKFQNFRILNRDKTVYTSAPGFYQLGSGLLENDFNEFSSLEIVNMKHGFDFSSRAIWNSYTNVHVYSSIFNGFNAVVTDNMSGHSFSMCRFGQNGGYGVYVEKNSGDALAAWTFENCTIEKNEYNGVRIAGTASGISGWSFIGCYFEENTRILGASSTNPRKANIYIEAQNCLGLVIDANTLFGTPLPTPLDWGIYISSTNATGRIGPCRTGVYAQGFASVTGSFLLEPQGGGTTGMVYGAGSKNVIDLVSETIDTYVATLTGCTTNPGGTVRAVKQDSLVTLYIPIIEGTSNTTAATLTGMSAGFFPTRIQSVIAPIKNNGVVVAALAQILTDGTIVLYSDIGGGAFTASGTKGIRSITITYSLD